MNLAKFSNQKFVKFILPLGITALLLSYLINKIDIKYLLSVQAEINWLLLITASIILIFFTALVFALRWQQSLKIIDYNITIIKAFVLAFASFPVSKLTPLNSGDLVRAYFLKDKIPITKNSGAIALERMIDFLVLAILAIIGGIITQKIYSIGIGALVIIVIISIIIMSQKIKLKKESKIKDKINNFLFVFKNTKNKRKNLIALFLFTILLWFGIIIYIKIVFLLFGYKVPIFLILAYQPIVVFLALVPITLSGIGSRETAMLFIYSGLAPDTAILFTGFAYSLVSVILLSILGLPFLYFAIKKGPLCNK
ncbi:flippase-like domain-containing protein [Candidatus Parcubacteria bacterium]|nr:flippase-like domain-containing protein [Candidatus Parcubacteria bacterium]